MIMISYKMSGPASYNVPIYLNFSHCQVSNNERVVDRLPLMTYGLKLSFEAWILKSKDFTLSFKEII